MNKVVKKTLKLLWNACALLGVADMFENVHKILLDR